MTKYPLPKIDSANYSVIALEKADIERILVGMKNTFSDYASFVVDNGKLLFRIGFLDYENIYEVEVKTVAPTAEKITFLSKLEYFERLFKSLDISEENNAVNLFIKPDAPLICLEKNDMTTTKYFVAPLDSSSKSK